MDLKDRPNPSFIWLPGAKHVVVGCMVYLMVGWAAFILIDVANLFGSRDAMVRMLRLPYTWYHLFKEGSPTEILQWTFLGGAAIVSCLLGGMLLGSNRRAAGCFWVLMGIATTLMLMEDAGNVRHLLQAWSGRLVAVKWPDRVGCATVCGHWGARALPT